MLQQPLQRVVANHRGLPAKLCAGFVDEVPGQQRNIVRSFAQWRQEDLHDAQAIIEILAKPAAGNKCLQVAMCRSDDARLGALAALRADREIFALLEDTKQA